MSVRYALKLCENIDKIFSIRVEFVVNMSSPGLWVFDIPSEIFIALCWSISSRLHSGCLHPTALTVGSVIVLLHCVGPWTRSFNIHGPRSVACMICAGAFDVEATIMNLYKLVGLGLKFAMKTWNCFPGGIFPRTYAVMKYRRSATLWAYQSSWAQHFDRRQILTFAWECVLWSN